MLTRIICKSVDLIPPEIRQAAQVLEHLAEARPGDLRLAAEALRKRDWGGKLQRAGRRLLAAHPEAWGAAKRIGSEKFSTDL